MKDHLETPRDCPKDCGGMRTTKGSNSLLIDGLSAVALNLYRPPFKYECGYVFDANHQMVSDDSGGTPLYLCDDRRADDCIGRVRGWGRIGKLKDGDAVQDAVGTIIAAALTEYWEKHQGR
jgi:hypothetical protein